MYLKDSGTFVWYPVTNIFDKMRKIIYEPQTPFLIYKMITTDLFLGNIEF